MIDRITEYRVLRNEAGRWFWHEVGGNGQIIGTSGQSFVSQASAMRACENAKARAAAAPIKVQDGHAAMNKLLRALAAGRAV
jgi:uncharacterized protein YegP (UPF0339 family)